MPSMGCVCIRIFAQAAAKLPTIRSYMRLSQMNPSRVLRFAGCFLVVMGAVLPHEAAAKVPARHRAHQTQRKQHAPYKLGARLPAAAAKGVVNIKAGGDQSVTATAATVPKLPVLTRAEILDTEPERLTRIGQHVIIGFHEFSTLRTLVEKKAIAGIFITTHNVAGHTAAQIKDEIDALQDIRKRQGLSPLIIAADQEGGQVSRLSPPLKKQQSLARALAGSKDDEARRKIVEDYAAVQASELKRIGVTVNFGPVVDLNLANAKREDGETMLRQRAIAADPYLVTKAAGWYCATLAKAGIMCTLKHFPGLGRVARDTHVASGDISASEGLLELNDWVPFRRLMNRANVATMLGHVRVAVIDKETPASFSKPVIGQLIRQTWEHDGLLITDDFSMGAISGSKDGVGGAAVKSINAGADLILVSFSEKYLDPVLSALIRADEEGALDAKITQASRARIARILRDTRDGGDN